MNDKLQKKCIYVKFVYMYKQLILKIYIYLTFHQFLKNEDF